MKMDTQKRLLKLGQVQLFSLKPEGMARRFKKIREQNADSAYLLQCAVVVLVKNALSPLDYSKATQETISKLLLEGDVKDLAAVRHLCVYFEKFFTTEEWKKVVDRLFKNQAEFLKVTASTQKTMNHLHKMLYCGKRQPKELMNIATVYKDANGKKHRFTIKDVDPCYSAEETTELLSILTTLTIFEKDGVRRFTDLVRYIYLSTTPIYDAEREEEAVAEEPAAATDEVTTSLEAQLAEAWAAFQKLKVSDEPDDGLVIESAHYLKNNVYAGKTFAEIAAYMFEGFVPDPAAEERVTTSRMAAALLGGIRLQQAKPLTSLSQIKDLTKPADPPKNDQPEKPKKTFEKPVYKKTKKDKPPVFSQEAIRKQREEEKKEREKRNAINKTKKGKGKGKGKKKKR